MGLRPQLAYGDLFTIKEFYEIAKNGTITDYDGTGYFATLDQESDIPARPSDVVLGGLRLRYTGEFTHVRWYNK